MGIEIQRADIRLRRLTVVVFMLAALGAVVVVLLASQWMIEQAIVSTPEQLVSRMRQWLGAVSIACGLCLLALAMHAWRRGRAASAERRWPLANARVLRDTPVYDEAAAERHWRTLTDLFAATLA